MWIMTADADEIHDYRNPFICKPFKEKNGTIFFGDKKKWVVLPWKDYKAATPEKIFFEHNGTLFAVPQEGYKCALRIDPAK